MPAQRRLERREHDRDAARRRTEASPRSATIAAPERVVRERPGSARGDAGYRPRRAVGILSEACTDTRTGRRWHAASSARFRALGGCGHVLDRIRRLAGRPYPGRVELAALVALYGVYELVRGFGGEDWAAARAHTADIVALERRLNLFVERDVQDLVGSVAGVPAAARLPLRRPPLRGHRSRPHLGPPAAPARVSVPAHDADRQHRARARRLRPLPGRAAAPREPRLRRHRQHAHGPEPQLRPARQPLQPDRGRAEPPLRLRADRRRRARAARLVPLAPPRSAPPTPR